MTLPHQAYNKSLRLAAYGLACFAWAGLTACSLLSPSAKVQSSHYTLDSALGGPPAGGALSATDAMAGATLVINPPQAASGFDSQRIIYVREDHKLEYFAHSEWVDSPARMLGPLMLAVVERNRAFSAVVLSAGSAAGEWRLDTKIIRLQHEFQFSPSRVRFTLRATLVEDKTRRVIAWQEFDATVLSASDDPKGGVAAANQAVQNVLNDLSQFLGKQKR